MRLLVWLTAILLVLPKPCPVAGQDLDQHEPFQNAIDRGLEYLHLHQNSDGSWTAGDNQGRDPAITALCVMAFLSAGHVPGEGPYAETVRKGITYVMGTQLRNGLICRPNAGNIEMYSHGICTLMLAEAVGLMPETSAKPLRKQLAMAIEVILSAQRQRGRDKGGWRYQRRGSDADISVTGWQVMALRAARNVGCDVPPERIDQAVAYIQKCFDRRTGGYRYQIHNRRVTVACTGTSILALELCGKQYHRSPEALRAGDYIKRTPLLPRQNHFFYGIYYTAQAMFQLGDGFWKDYRPILHTLLLQELPQRANGSWRGRGWDDRSFGPNYCTAMAILALTVEYRFLPIYQRGKDTAE